MSTPNQGFARAHFSTESLSPADRLPYYRDVICRTVAKCDIEPLDGRFRFDASMLPGLGVARVAATPARVTLTRQLASACPDDLLFMIYRRGSWTMSQLGREISLKGASAALLSCSDPMTLQRSSVQFASITIPRASLAPMISNLDAAMMSPVPADCEAMRLLNGYLDTLLRDTPVTAPEVRRLALNHIHDLVAVAVGATRDAAQIAKGRGVGAARLASVKADIMAHLGHHDLTVGAVAIRQGISEPYMRKLFANEDTSFSDFVLSRRLASAHRMLTDRRFADRSITSIAYDAGFSDLSYFNRCFRRRFGDTPSAIRASAGANRE